MDLLGKLERSRGQLPLAGMGSAGDHSSPWERRLLRPHEREEEPPSPREGTQPFTSPSSTVCPPAAHTHVAVLQRLVLLGHLQENLLQCGVH